MKLIQYVYYTINHSNIEENTNTLPVVFLIKFHVIRQDLTTVRDPSLSLCPATIKNNSSGLSDSKKAYFSSDLQTSEQ